MKTFKILTITLLPVLFSGCVKPNLEEIIIPKEYFQEVWEGTVSEISMQAPPHVTSVAIQVCPLKS